MATVPRTQLPGVAPTAAPNVQQSNPNSADLMSIGARQAQQFGQAVTGAGAALGQIERQEAEQANALRVDDALNLATEKALRLQHDPKEGYTTQTGYAALSRESGLPLADEYTQKLTTDFDAISASLGNDRQRQMFAMRANNIKTQFFGGALNYESQQQKEYTLSVREATVKNAADALVMNATDPENVAAQMTRIRSSVMGGVDPDSKVFVPGSAQLTGKSAAWAQEKADEAVSGAHTMAIQSFMEKGNITGAMSYRKAYGKDMTAGDMIKIDGTLQRNYDTMQGTALGNQIVAAAKPSLNPTEFDRFSNVVGIDKLTSVVRNIESGGRETDASGNVLTSPKGAKGSMQVLDGTNRDPGFGVRPAQDDSPAERARVGRDYLAAMVKRYDGDILKAAAAYNMGPGALDKAVKDAGASRGGDRTWQAYLPEETKKYVANVVTQMSGNGGKPERPTLEQLQQTARARLGPDASPIMVKSALDTISQQFTADTQAIAQRKDELVAKGYAELTQNGGRWSELSPNLRAQIMRDAPDKADELQNFGVRFSKGDDVTDDRLYLRLSNPQALASMTDAQFYALRGGLSQSDFQHFTKQRADIKAGKSSDTAGDLNTGAVSRVLDQRLRTIGIDPTPKDGTDDAQRVGAIRRTVDASLLDAQRQAGKKFTDAEVQKHIDEQMATNVKLKDSFLWIDTSTNRQVMGLRFNDIPSVDRERIRAAFKKQGNDNPQQGEILGAYMAGNLKK